MSNRMWKGKRFLQVIGFGLLLLLVLLYIGYPSLMAILVIIPDRSSDTTPPAGFSDMSFMTSDGIQLTGWYAESKNSAAIILVHGAGSGRESVRSYATMLHENGFGVLAVNMRGYGDSEGRINRLGWNGTQDIGAAVNYLNGHDEVEVIGGMGISMGGEILLGAASTYPVIQAIITDGATYRCIQEYTALPANRPLYRNFTQRIFSFMVAVFSGSAQPQPTLLESMQRAEATSFLFIAAGNDDTETAYNQLFNQTVPDRSSMWVISDVTHTGGFSHDPQTYEQNVIDFFKSVLLTTEFSN